MFVCKISRWEGLSDSPSPGFLSERRLHISCNRTGLTSRRALGKGSWSAHVTSCTNPTVISGRLLTLPKSPKHHHTTLGSIQPFQKSLSLCFLPTTLVHNPPKWRSCSGKPWEVSGQSVMDAPSQNDDLENIRKSQYSEKLSLVPFLKFFLRLNPIAGVT